MRDGADEALVRQVKVDPGSPRARWAATQLLERYQERVYIWCLRIVRDHDQALDLAQEVLLSAYRGLEGFGERSSFSSWLFAIARNRCISLMRRPSLVVDDDVESLNVAGDQPGPDRALEERLDEEGVFALIREQLEPIEQEAIWLRCFERLPVDEITALLKIDAASGARGVLQSARRKLRAALSERDKEEGAGSA